MLQAAAHIKSSSWIWKGVRVELVNKSELGVHLFHRHKLYWHNWERNEEKLATAHWMIIVVVGSSWRNFREKQNCAAKRKMYQFHIINTPLTLDHKLIMKIIWSEASNKRYYLALGIIAAPTEVNMLTKGRPMMCKQNLSLISPRTRAATLLCRTEKIISRLIVWDEKEN